MPSCPFCGSVVQDLGKALALVITCTCGAEVVFTRESIVYKEPPTEGDGVIKQTLRFDPSYQGGDL